MKMLIQYQGNVRFYNKRFIFLLISYFSSRSNTKFLSPATCPTSPWTTGPPTNGFVTSISSNELSRNENSYLHSTTFNFNNKLSSNDTDNDNNNIQLLPDDLQSSSKEGKKEIFYF
jgi:hypothetical protein